MQTFSKVYRHSRHILRNINSKVCCISTYRYTTITKNKDTITWKDTVQNVKLYVVNSVHHVWLHALKSKWPWISST